MDIDKYSTGVCPIGRALTRAGDAWSMLILRDAAAGRTRFDQFQKSLGIAPNILTRRLAALTEAGLFERRLYSEHPPRHEYVLTNRGRDLLPVLYALGAWGGKHFAENDVTRLIDAESGAEIEAIVVDRATGRPLSDIAMRADQPVSV